MRLYKGHKYDLSVLFYPCVGVVSDAQDLEIAVYTTCASASVIYFGESISESGAVATIHIGESDFDGMDDGLLKYVANFTNSSGVAFTYESTTTAWLTTPTDYSGATYTLQEKDIVMTGESATVRADEGYYGLSEVGITTEIPLQEKSVTATNPSWVEEYTPDEGYVGLSKINVNTFPVWENGAFWARAQMKESAFTENGIYEYSDGWKKITINVSGGTDPEVIKQAYESGITKGMADQKALLVSTAITANGTYTKEDGFSSVTVNVSAVEGLGDYHIGLGFYPQGNRVRFSDDTAAERYMSDYISTIYVPELNFKRDDPSGHFSLDFTDGEYHTVWFKLKSDIPNTLEFVQIYTSSQITLLVAKSNYFIGGNMLKESSQYTDTVSTIIDFAPSVPTLGSSIGAGILYYPNGRAASSASTFQSVAMSQPIADSIKNLYKF